MKFRILANVVVSMRMKLFAVLIARRLLWCYTSPLPSKLACHLTNDKKRGPRLDIIFLLRPLWTEKTQSLACQEFFCVDYMIEAFRTEATLESLVPHLEI